MPLIKPATLPWNQAPGREEEDTPQLSATPLSRAPTEPPWVARSVKMLPWVRLPSKWIEDRGLRDFGWGRGEGANNTAALMVLAALTHQTDAVGTAAFTYDRACRATGLSRAKVSAGLKVLIERSLIERGSARSSFRLSGYDKESGWAKFPAARLYRDGAIVSFQGINLRKRVELDALKLYYLFASRRDRKTGAAVITYQTIEDYSGVPRNNIRAALTWLAAEVLVHIDHVPSRIGEGHIINAYRLVHLDNRQHMGTSWRAQLLDSGMLPTRSPSPMPTDDY
ncbi:hypothetical protein [Reyranella sp.]|uniref:hypothetical protein n=1 Tax=Reyranella sp. TaxID=1929291 RepID=UPI003BAC97F8